MQGVSYLVSSYNKRPWLPAVLRSVARERAATGGEIVLIDDGSTDGSAEICRDFAAAEPAVRLTLQENRGIFAVTNRLTASARCEWIRLVDSDDPLRPGTTAAMTRAADRDGFDYVFGRMDPYGPDPLPEGAEGPPVAPDAFSGAVTAVDDPYRYAIREFDHVPSTTIFRRALLEGCAPLPEHFVSCQDLALALRLFARARVGRIAEPVCNQLVGVPGRLSAQESLTFRQTALIIGEYGAKHFTRAQKAMAVHKLTARAIRYNRRNAWWLLLYRMLPDDIEAISVRVAAAHR